MQLETQTAQPARDKEPELTWVVATDGSADHTVQMGAWAWWAKDGTHSATCEAGLTSANAEWAAVEAALLAAPAGVPVVIFSDFKLAVKTLNRLNSNVDVRIRSQHTDPVFAARLARIEELVAQRKVTARWVRSHTGKKNQIAKLNHKVDHLARATLRQARLSPHQEEHFLLGIA